MPPRDDADACGTRIRLQARVGEDVGASYSPIDDLGVTDALDSLAHSTACERWVGLSAAEKRSL